MEIMELTRRSEKNFEVPHRSAVLPEPPTTSFRAYEMRKARKSICVSGWESWRSAAFYLVKAQIHPDEISWSHSHVAFPEERQREADDDLLDYFETAACHRSPEKWGMFYRIFWRARVEGQGLSIKDAGVQQMIQMENAVTEDISKMKSGVRFRREKKSGHHFTWYRPEHCILKKMTHFFRQSLGPVRWTVLTPDRSYYWDLSRLAESRGVPEDPFRGKEVSSDLWPIYHSSLFKRPV